VASIAAERNEMTNWRSLTAEVARNLITSHPKVSAKPNCIFSAVPNQYDVTRFIALFMRNHLQLLLSA